MCYSSMCIAFPLYHSYYVLDSYYIWCGFIPMTTYCKYTTQKKDWRWKRVEGGSNPTAAAAATGGAAPRTAAAAALAPAQGMPTRRHTLSRSISPSLSHLQLTLFSFFCIDGYTRLSNANKQQMHQGEPRRRWDVYARPEACPNSANV